MDLHYKLGGISDDFPFLLSHEATGVVSPVGPGVTDVAPGAKMDPEADPAAVGLLGHIPARRRHLDVSTPMPGWWAMTKNATVRVMPPGC
jgi:hypothetical protein